MKALQVNPALLSREDKELILWAAISRSLAELSRALGVSVNVAARRLSRLESALESWAGVEPLERWKGGPAGRLGQGPGGPAPDASMA